jgi:dihydroflavonol-4-reductase
MSRVLVTGGSGFVASHVIAQLLKAGHDVRTTVRSLSREAEVRSMVNESGAFDEKLTFVEADLSNNSGWAEAVHGCEYVMHVASPMPAKQPKDENELIVPARDGVIRVLRFARDAQVRRVVFTSTCGAIYYGHPKREKPFDETDWTNIEGGPMSAYVKSKALAERAAWDFMAREGGALELAVVNPAGIFGPSLGKDVSSSLEIIIRLLNGMPGCPQIFFGVVDVRDVADLHLRAMTDPKAKGERFIAVCGPSMSMLEVAQTLRSGLGEKANKVPTRALPNWLVRFIANFDASLKTLTPMLGNPRHASSEKAQRVLGWKPRPAEEALLSSARSLIQYGVVA